MSLATRCTACGTIFRVVQDQLRVSEGWVRCGRCAEVFDARQQLFDMEREAPPPWTASQPMPLATEPEPLMQEPAPMAARPSSFGAMQEPPQQREHVQPPAPVPPPPAPAPVFVPEPEPVAPPQSAGPVYETPEIDPPAAGTASASAAPVSTFGERIEPSFEANFTASVEDHASERDAGPSTMLAADAAEPAAPPAEPAVAEEKPRKTKSAKATKSGKSDEAAKPENYVPSFMRHTQRSESGRQRSVRAALIVASGALGVLLGVQAALHWRDAIAAAYPPARGTLEALCHITECHIEPWRRIDVLSVENSALAQAGMGNQYQLTVSLRNKAGYDVALPWIDLSLTDAGGAIVSRRALSPMDFRVGLDGKPVSIAAGAEQSLQVVLNTGTQKVSGYTVEIFNP